MWDGARGSPAASSVFGLLICAGNLCTSRRVEAAPKVQGVGETSVGYTDNIQSTPDAPGAPPKQSGAFVLLSPGIVVAMAAPGYVQRLSYVYTFDFFVAHTNPSTSSNRLAYFAFFDISPTVGLVLDASATQSNWSSALVLTPPAAGVVNALPPGSGSFLSGTASELLSCDVAIGWRAYESVTATEQTPLFETVAPRTFAPSGRVGVERSWERDAVGLEARADYSAITGSIRPDGAPLGPQRQIVAAGLASWRHDWGRWFTSRTEAGVLRVERLNAGLGFWEPTGVAALAYVTEFGDAEARYAHTVTTNPLIGQTLLVDEVRLRGTISLTKKGELLVGGSTGYQLGSVLGEDLRVAARVDAVLFDVGVGFQIAAPLLLGLRYQHVLQISDASVPPLPLSFVRNSVLFGVTLRFPPESEMPRGYRAPRRVDRTDEIGGAAVTPTARAPGDQPTSR